MGGNQLRRVLIVDPDDGSRVAAEQYLASAHWRVRSSACPREALAMLSTRGFDAILVDLRLDEGAPEAALRVAAAARRASQRTRIVVLGDRSSDADALVRLEPYATAVIRRPQTMQVVERALRGLPPR